MKASIIITSFNRSHLLSFGLESLARQGFGKDVEVLVLNDGDPNDSTEGVCKLFDEELNIRYFASSTPIQWRIPGFAINYGVLQSKGEFIFISCAEMYHLDNTVELMLNALSAGGKIMTIPNSGKDDNGQFLSKLQNGIMFPSGEDYDSLEPLWNIHLPFFIGMRKDVFVNMGGYDEDFIGVGFDDNDIVHRLQRLGYRYRQANCRIVHLYHPRLNFHDPAIQRRFRQNQSLFQRKTKLSPIRNHGRNWGQSF